MASRSVWPAETIRFGDDFELDLRTYELRGSGERLRLERIPTDLLLFLIEQRGQIVTRDQIIERIWGKDVFLDTDNSINAAIWKIRQTLKDDPESPRFVQTVKGKGYRFIAPILDDLFRDDLSPPLEVIPRPPGLPDLPNKVAPLVSIPLKTARDLRKWKMLLVAMAVAIVGLSCLLRSRNRLRPAAVRGRLMLAILPFENLTGDGAQEYFGDGLTEEMITRLGSVDPSHLGVIARTSIMRYKNSPLKVAQIGRELGVSYVLEGSVRRNSEKVRITAQLIRVQDQTQVWARQYDRELNDLLSLQSEITQETSDEIQLALGEQKLIQPVSREPLPPPSYEAYDLYLKGQYFFNKRTVEGFQRSIDYFQQAIAKDPYYARAYAGLADSYALIGGYSVASQTEFMPKARAAALRAVELDQNLAEAHTALALVIQNYDWDWQSSENEFRRAIELDPNYATAHHWYAEHLTWRGRFDEALRESERARQLDPLSLIIAADNGAILYFSRQYDQAIAKFRAVRELDPNFPHACMIVHAYVQKGMYSAVLSETENLRRILGESAWLDSEDAYVYGRTGQSERVRTALAKMKRANRRQSIDPGIFVIPYVATGDKDQAFVWLEKAYAQHSNVITQLKVDPVYDPLRGDPRFQSLLRRVGLAD